METSEVPAEFIVTDERVSHYGERCVFCQEYPRKVTMCFGYASNRLVVAGLACTEKCAHTGLWKQYVLSRLKGTLDQQPFERDDGPHGDHAED